MYSFMITIFANLSTPIIRYKILIMDIKQEIQVLLLRQGMSMSKLTRLMKQNKINNINITSLSRMLTTKTIKFETVQEILDFLGYELVIKKK